jgi:hypothetical protein
MDDFVRAGMDAKTPVERWSGNVNGRRVAEITLVAKS